MTKINEVAMQLLIDENKSLKAKILDDRAAAINEFAYLVVETGQLSNSDNEFLTDFAKEVVNNDEKDS